MKKKRIRFYQLSIWLIYDIIISLAFWGVCVITIVWAIMDSDDGFTYKRWLFIPDWLMITMVVIGFARSILEWLVYAYHIDFEDGMIKTDGHRLTAKKFRLQFKLNIKITDITAIRVIKSNYNSLKKSSSVLYNKAPATYFEFTLSNGRTKWLYIHTYSKKQRIKMINIINEELGTNYDYVEMYKNGEQIKGGSIFNRDRSKKKKKEKSIHNDKNEI